jgi:hypothetical protein
MMETGKLDYWYDGQLRRYWEQFIRIFYGISYETGIGANGTRALKTFPVKLALKNRQVGHILRNNSENTINSTPAVTCEMTAIELAPERRQNPNHVSSVNVVERAIDPATNRYTSERGKSYTVERFMAIPYDITMRVDVWTSNEDQKAQFMEQVLTLFNPSIDLQTGVNPIDWTSLTIVELQTIDWSNRSMPIGQSDEIEISSLTFKMPIWITPPAKVKRQNIIHQIITNIGELNSSYQTSQFGGYNFGAGGTHTRTIVTPDNLCVDVTGNEITLLDRHGNVHNTNGGVLDWRETISKLGQYRAGVTQLRVKTNDNMDDHTSDIVGIFDFHPTEPNKLLWTIDLDTLPTNTLAPVTAIISLQGKVPGRGLPPLATGQRYLLTEDLQPVEEWSFLAAEMNDIIEYNGTDWTVVFDASTVSDSHYLVNLYSAKQLRWTGETWVVSVDGTYRPGYWRIFM